MFNVLNLYLFYIGKLIFNFCNQIQTSFSYRVRCWDYMAYAITLNTIKLKYLKIICVILIGLVPSPNCMISALFHFKN